MDLDRRALDEWAKDKPLSILQLDPADRAVLKIAGKLRSPNILSGQETVLTLALVHRTQTQFFTGYNARTLQSLDFIYKC